MSITSLDQIQEAIQHFGLNIHQINQVPESNSSVVRILTLTNGKKMVLKLSYNLRKFQREKFALTTLKEHPLTPRLLDSFETDQLMALLLEYKEGLPISKHNNCNSYMASQIGEAMALIHEVPMVDFEGYDNWKDFLLNKVKLYVDNCRNFNPEPELDEAEHVLTSCLTQSFVLKQACLIHFDLRLGNILFHKDKVVAIIDFESAKGGSGDMDFFKIWRELWRPRPELQAPLVDAYMTIRQPEMDINMVIPLYYLYHSLGGMNWCIERNRVNNPFYHENRQGMEEALELLAPYVKG